MTLQKLQALHPNATKDTWHQHLNGGGWVENTALVHGTARVAGTARVSGTAQVHGTARVSGAANVSSGNNSKSPLYIQGTRHTITVCSFECINIGCFTKSITEWMTCYVEFGANEGYTKKEVAEYGKYIALAQMLTRKDKKDV